MNTLRLGSTLLDQPFPLKLRHRNQSVRFPVKTLKLGDSLFLFGGEVCQRGEDERDAFFFSDPSVPMPQLPLCPCKKVFPSK